MVRHDMADILFYLFILSSIERSDLLFIDDIDIILLEYKI